MIDPRSTHTLIRFDLPFNTDLHTVDRLRPLACSACNRPRGAPGDLGLHGHGVRYRQQRGPTDFDHAPTIIDVPVRRYICTACHAITTVTPPMLPRKLFSAFAIAWALALYGLLGRPPRVVRQRISPWAILGAAGAQTWRSLARWAGTAQQLFATPPVRDDASLRDRAHRVAMTLSARAGPDIRDDVPQDHRAAIGATRSP